ncbi:MAG: hypothetical protein WC211_00750 [Dehalococcoidia bacterium]
MTSSANDPAIVAAIEALELDETLGSDHARADLFAAIDAYAKRIATGVMLIKATMTPEERDAAVGKLRALAASASNIVAADEHGTGDGSANPCQAQGGTGGRRHDP